MLLDVIEFYCFDTHALWRFSYTPGDLWLIRGWL